MKRILLIIPAYNEQESILSTIQMITDYNLQASNKIDYIVVNDGLR